MAALTTHVQCLIHKIQQMPKEEFESYIEKGIISVADELPSDFRMEPIVVHTEWAIRQTSGGDGDLPITVFIVPRGSRARKIWMVGQIALAVGRGLTPIQAERWADSRVKQKHVLFDLILKAQEDLNYREAYKTYVHNQTTYQLNAWAKLWGIDDKFSRSHRLAVMSLFNEIFLD